MLPISFSTAQLLHDEKDIQESLYVEFLVRAYHPSLDTMLICLQWWHRHDPGLLRVVLTEASDPSFPVPKKPSCDIHHLFPDLFLVGLHISSQLLQTRIPPSTAGAYESAEPIVTYVYLVPLFHKSMLHPPTMCVAFAMFDKCCPHGKPSSNNPYCSAFSFFRPIVFQLNNNAGFLDYPSPSSLSHILCIIIVARQTQTHITHPWIC